MSELKLPDGQYSNDYAEFWEAWRAIIEPIEVLLDVRIETFGPGIRWHEGNFMTDLSVETARKIIDLGVRALTVEAKRDAAMKKEKKEND